MIKILCEKKLSRDGVKNIFPYLSCAFGKFQAALCTYTYVHTSVPQVKFEIFNIFYVVQCIHTTIHSNTTALTRFPLKNLHSGGIRPQKSGM
jgi:hypothetical protein